MMKKAFFLSVLIFLISGYAYAARVENVTAKQSGNRVIFDFDVTGAEEEAEVVMTLKIKRKKYAAAELDMEGDYGKVEVGPGKRIFWNVVSDFPRGYKGKVYWEINAEGITKRGEKAGRRQEKRDVVVPLPSF